MATRSPEALKAIEEALQRPQPRLSKAQADLIRALANLKLDQGKQK